MTEQGRLPTVGVCVCPLTCPHIFKGLFEVRDGLGFSRDGQSEATARGMYYLILSIKVLINMKDKHVCMCVCAGGHVHACMHVCVKWEVVFPHCTVLIGEWEHTGSKVCWEFKP